MRYLFILFSSPIRILLTCLKPGGIKAVIAENILLRSQLLVVSRQQKRAPRLTHWKRLLFAFFAGLTSPKRLIKSAVIIKPSTLLKFHSALVRRKYRRLFSNKDQRKRRITGPSQDLIRAILEMKRQNPRFGCRRIAMQINSSFGLSINKDVVWRILAKHYKPTSGGGGPSWLTLIGHMKDNLWSLDFFRCESISLRTHWVMVVMDQFTRRIIGFSVHPGDLSGPVICRMFNRIIIGNDLPKYLSSDNDPLFKFDRWGTNLRILKINPIKSIPYTPTSHPFVERLIRTCRNEVLDKTLFWGRTDLECKLKDFQKYFNENRAHMGINGAIPKEVSDDTSSKVISLANYRWQKHCQGLFSLPAAA